MGSIMDYLLLIIGAYVLFNGIRGKGKLFTAENIKEGYEEKFKKTLRSIYLPMGVVMLINGGMSLLRNYLYEQGEVAAATETMPAVFDWVLKEGRDLGGFTFLTPKFFNIFAYVFMGLVVAGVITLIFVMRKMTDRNPPPKANPNDPDAQKRTDRQAGHSLPVSAFEFDDEA